MSHPIARWFRGFHIDEALECLRAIGDSGRISPPDRENEILMTRLHHVPQCLTCLPLWQTASYAARATVWHAVGTASLTTKTQRAPSELPAISTSAPKTVRLSSSRAGLPQWVHGLVTRMCRVCGFRAVSACSLVYQRSASVIAHVAATATRNKTITGHRSCLRLKLYIRDRGIPT